MSTSRDKGKAWEAANPYPISESLIFYHVSQTFWLSDGLATVPDYADPLHHIMATYVADNDNTGFDDMYFAAPAPSEM